MADDFEARLRAVLEAIASSGSPRKLIVAGPGTGKTTMFGQVLERREGSINQKLVLTFINNLKAELDEKLGKLARVFTFHGYCHYLLRRSPRLRTGLTERFRYFPPLASLIKTDWEQARDGSPPQFVGFMRRLESGREIGFYMERADYYDAVGFDDSVFRVHGRLCEDPELIEPYDIVFVDEYQDFNRLEASFIALLATRSPIIIAGDDDQALYSQLRGSSPEFIRQLYRSGDYECLDLPFCLRCPEVVVGAVADVVQQARRGGKLEGRIDKPYHFSPPRKAGDSERYPRIRIVDTSVQSLRANYFGKYIAQQIGQIPPEEIAESHAQGFPTVLVIGPIQYLRQVRRFLDDSGFVCAPAGESEAATLERSDALRILHADVGANLGWRAILELDRPPSFRDLVRQSVQERTPLVEMVPSEYRQHVAAEATGWHAEEPEEVAVASSDVAGPTVKLTSFEGSKGLSAQRVFILGLQEGELPRDATNPSDLEICKFIVALTRTRKQCHVIYTRRWGTGWKQPSIFLSWIRRERKDLVTVNRNYW